MWKEITMLSFPPEFAAPEGHWHKVGTESKIVELVFEICNANIYLEWEKKKEELNHDIYFSSFSSITKIESWHILFLFISAKLHVSAACLAK